MGNAALQLEKEQISSLDLAKEFGKRHQDVLRDVRLVSKNTGIAFVESVYVDSQKRKKCHYMLCGQLADAMYKRYNGLRFGLSTAEKIALNTIEQVLGINLIRQCRVLNYRIDGYDPVNNIAYEIDEPEHQYKKEQDEIRQRRIENELGCKFVRIKV